MLSIIGSILLGVMANATYDKLKNWAEFIDNEDLEKIIHYYIHEIIRGADLDFDDININNIKNHIIYNTNFEENLGVFELNNGIFVGDIFIEGDVFKDARNSTIQYAFSILENDDLYLLHYILQEQKEHCSKERNARNECTLTSTNDKRKFLINSKIKIETLDSNIALISNNINLNKVDNDRINHAKEKLNNLCILKYFNNNGYKEIQNIESYFTFVLESNYGTRLFVKVIDDKNTFNLIDTDLYNDIINNYHNRSILLLTRSDDIYKKITSLPLGDLCLVKRKEELTGITQEIDNYLNGLKNFINISPKFKNYRIAKSRYVALKIHATKIDFKETSDNYIDQFINSSIDYFGISGKPGAGKTTLCLQYIDKIISNGTNHRLVPIYIDLGDYPKGSDGMASFTTFIDVFTESYSGAKLSKTTIEFLLRQNRLLVFLDGFDELISTNDQDFINDKIELVSRIMKVEGLKTIVTVRSNYLKTYFSTIQNRIKYIGEVQDFSQDDCIKYINRSFDNKEIQKMIIDIYKRDNTNIFINFLNIPRALNAFLDSLEHELPAKQLQSYSYLNIFDTIHKRWLLGNKESQLSYLNRFHMVTKVMEDIAVSERTIFRKNYFKKIINKYNVAINIEDDLQLSPFFFHEKGKYTFVEPMRSYFAFLAFDNMFSNKRKKPNLVWEEINRSKILNSELIIDLFIDKYKYQEKEALFDGIFGAYEFPQLKTTTKWRLGHLLRNIKLNKSNLEKLETLVATTFDINKNKIIENYTNTATLSSLIYQYANFTLPKNRKLKKLSTEYLCECENILSKSPTKIFKSRNLLIKWFFFCFATLLSGNNLPSELQNQALLVFKRCLSNTKSATSDIDLWFSMFILQFCDPAIKGTMCHEYKDISENHSNRYIRWISEFINTNECVVKY